MNKLEMKNNAMKNNDNNDSDSIDDYNPEDAFIPPFA